MIQSTSRAAGLALLLISFTVPTIVTAAELHVGPAQTYATISDAIAAAGEGDEIIAHENGGTPDYQEEIIVDVAGLSLREAPGDDVSIQSADVETHVIVVTANGVTIEDFDIFGTLDGSNLPGAIGIYLNDADSCTVRNNRCGWDADHKLLWGIHLRNEANFNEVSGNTCSHNREVGIHLHGSDHNLIAENICNHSRDHYHTEHGIGLYSSVYNSVIGNTCNSNPRGISVVTNSSHNIITGNTCDNNALEGMRLYESSYDIVTNNVTTANQHGIYMTYLNRSMIVGNTSSGNTEYGIYLFGYDNHGFFNNLSANGSDNLLCHSSGSRNTWRSLPKLSYFAGGPAYKNYLGNYYGDYTGVDADGDGIGDTPYVGDDFTDSYPLITQSSAYTLETWFLNDGAMYGDDVGHAAGDPNIPPGGTLVWVADQAADIDATFLAGLPDDQTNWTYQLLVPESMYSPDNNLILTLGHANEDGADFTSVAGEPSTAPADASTIYLAGAFDVAQEFTVPAGRHLALQIENTHGTYDYTILGGGSRSYISASYPSPAYPVGGASSAVDEDPARVWQIDMLHAAQPNPFTSQVRIDYELPHEMPVVLSIHDETGRLVRTLITGSQSAGQHKLSWDGLDETGQPEASGVYFCRLTGHGAASVRRIVRVR